MAEQDDEPLDIVPVLLASFLRRPTLPFRFRSLTCRDPSGAAWTIFSADGETQLTLDGLSPPPKKERFSDTITVPGDCAPDDLRQLTDELVQSTAEAADIEIGRFEFRWGVKCGMAPYLKSVSGAFTCSAESRAYRRALADVLSFVALESTQESEAGRCFSRRGICAGARMRVSRERIEVWRIKRLARGIPVDDPADFVRFVKRRIASIFPGMMQEDVPVCRNCYAFYARERRLSPDQPRSFVSMTSTRRAADREHGRSTDDHADTAPPSGKIRPIPTKLVPPGTTYDRRTVMRTVRWSHRPYLSSSFPANIQTLKPRRV
jgi:hypothetical protein